MDLVLLAEKAFDVESAMENAEDVGVSILYEISDAVVTIEDDPNALLRAPVVAIPPV